MLGAKTAEEGARIQGIFHTLFFACFGLPSKTARSSSDRVSSNSSGIAFGLRKLQSCAWRRQQLGLAGAIGTPRFAMVISSPAATSHRSRENWALASCVFTVFTSFMLDQITRLKVTRSPASHHENAHT